MYDLSALVGKITTVKALSGFELIGKLIGYDEEELSITLEKPKLIVVAENEIATMPVTFTAIVDMLHLEKSQYIGIFESGKVSADDYIKQIQEEQSNNKATKKTGPAKTTTEKA